jgi:hypothetical protein
MGLHVNRRHVVVSGCLVVRIHVRDDADRRRVNDVTCDAGGKRRRARFEEGEACKKRTGQIVKLTLDVPSGF